MMSSDGAPRANEIGAGSAAMGLSLGNRGRATCVTSSTRADGGERSGDALRVRLATATGVATQPRDHEPRQQREDHADDDLGEHAAPLLEHRLDRRAEAEAET